METIGKRISMLRKEKELKQDELAEILGVSPQAVSKWENDVTCPDISLLPKIADTFGVSIDALFREESKPAVTLLPKEKRKDVNDMVLRVVCDSAEGDRVRVNLPMILVVGCLEAGIELPDMIKTEGTGFSLKNIDLNKIVELVNKGVVGNFVECESAEGDSVKVFVE